MRRAFLILLVVVLAVVISIPILLYQPRYGETGGDPVIDAILVDNGENDYVIFKFISAGTGFYRLYPIEAAETSVIIRWDNNSFTFGPLEPREISPGDNVKVAFNADVVQVGKVYSVAWWGQPFYKFGKEYGWSALTAVAENT